MEQRGSYRYKSTNPFDGPYGVWGVFGGWIKQEDNPHNMPEPYALSLVGKEQSQLVNKEWPDLDKPEILAGEEVVAAAAIVFEPGHAQTMAQASKMLIEPLCLILIPCPNTPSDGKYDFVRTRAWRGRDLIVMMTAAGGNEGLTRHVNLSREKNASFAGMALFRNGTLVRWTNWSGHYQCGAWNAYQAGLPLDLFVPFTSGWADGL